MTVKRFTTDKVDDIGFIHVFVNRVLIKSGKSVLTNLKLCVSFNAINKCKMFCPSVVMGENNLILETFSGKVC